MTKLIVLLGVVCIVTACQSSSVETGPNSTVLAFAAGNGTYRLTPACTDYASVYRDKAKKPFVWIQVKNSLQCSQRAYEEVFSRTGLPLHIYFHAQEMSGRLKQRSGNFNPVTLFLMPAGDNEALADEIADALNK